MHGADEAKGLTLKERLEHELAEAKAAIKLLRQERDEAQAMNDDLFALCEEINHACWPDPDASHDTSEAPARIDQLRRACNVNAHTEIERLRKQLRDTQTRLQTVVADGYNSTAERDRDEAREAARWVFDGGDDMSSAMKTSALQQWPWLEETE